MSRISVQSFENSLYAIEINLCTVTRSTVFNPNYKNQTLLEGGDALITRVGSRGWTVNSLKCFKPKVKQPTTHQVIEVDAINLIRNKVLLKGRAMTNEDSLHENKYK